MTPDASTQHRCEGVTGIAGSGRRTGHPPADPFEPRGGGFVAVGNRAKAQLLQHQNHVGAMSGDQMNTLGQIAPRQDDTRYRWHSDKVRCGGRHGCIAAIRNRRSHDISKISGLPDRNDPRLFRCPGVIEPNAEYDMDS